MSKDPFIQAFGEVVRNRREARGLSQEALADEAGLHRTAITHIERATRSSTLETVLKLALALQTQPRDLIPAIDLKRDPAKRRTRKR